MRRILYIKDSRRPGVSSLRVASPAGGHLGVLAPQIRLGGGRNDGAHNQHHGHGYVGGNVPECGEQLRVEEREADAEGLGGGVQQSGGGALGLWERQLGPELKAHRQVASHEEAARELALVIRTSYMHFYQKYQAN